MMSKSRNQHTLISRLRHSRHDLEGLPRYTIMITGNSVTFRYGTRLPGYKQAYEEEKSRNICLADDHVRLVIASPSMKSHNGQNRGGEKANSTYELCGDIIIGYPSGHGKQSTHRTTVTKTAKAME